MLKTYEAHLARTKGALMEIQIHGGSRIIVPKIEGIDDTTLLVVTMEPGSKSTASVMTMDQFNAATTEEPSGEEHIEEMFDDETEFDVGLDWDCSPPVE